MDVHGKIVPPRYEILWWSTVIMPDGSGGWEITDNSVDAYLIWAISKLVYTTKSLVTERKKNAAAIRKMLLVLPRFIDSMPKVIFFIYKILLASIELEDVAENNNMPAIVYVCTSEMTNELQSQTFPACAIATKDLLFVLMWSVPLLVERSHSW